MWHEPTERPRAGSAVLLLLLADFLGALAFGAIVWVIFRI